MRGIDGVSPVTLISIGDNTGNGTGNTNAATGTLDLTGGIADIKVTSLVMGTSTFGTVTNVAHGARGTLTFNGGTVDATTIILGNMTADLNTNRDTTGDSAPLMSTARQILWSAPEASHWENYHQPSLMPEDRPAR